MGDLTTSLGRVVARGALAILSASCASHAGGDSSLSADGGADASTTDAVIVFDNPAACRASMAQYCASGDGSQCAPWSTAKTSEKQWCSYGNVFTAPTNCPTLNVIVTSGFDNSASYYYDASSGQLVAIVDGAIGSRPATCSALAAGYSITPCQAGGGCCEAQATRLCPAPPSREPTDAAAD